MRPNLTSVGVLRACSRRALGIAERLGDEGAAAHVRALLALLAQAGGP
jgi:hypothetical protein